MSDVNQIDLLRARVIASMPSKQKSQQPRPVGKQQPEVEREEGELCSSDDDDQVSPSSQPTSGRGLPSNIPRVGGYPELVPQEKLRTFGITGASNVLMTEATTSSTPNANANAIVRKSELLSGLNAPAPFTISMKSPNEVEITKFSVASQTHVQTPLAGVDLIKQHRSAVQISEREPTTSQGLVGKKLSVAAPVYRPSPNGSSARQPITLPITLGKNSGRAEDVAKVFKGTPGLSFHAPHRPFSPPFAASHKPFSPLVGGARASTSGARSQPVPHSADRTEANTLLAGLSLPGGRTGTLNSEFIINFDDSDSDGERVQTQPPAQAVQPRSGVNNRIGATAGEKSISRTLLTPPNGNLVLLRPRVGRTTGLSLHNKTTVSTTRAGTMVRPASVLTKSPPPHRPDDAQIEILRQQIAVKQSLLDQSKRVSSQLPEPRVSRAAAVGGSIQDATNMGTPKVGRTVGNPLAVNSTSKTPFKKKPRISNLAQVVDSRLSSVKAKEAEILSGGGTGKVVSGKASDYQVSARPTAAIQQADVAVLGAKESGTTSSFRSIEEVRNVAPSRGAVVIPAVGAGEPSRTGTSYGAAAAVSTKLVESSRRSTSGVPVIESGVTKPVKGEPLQISSETTGTGETTCSIQLSDVMPACLPTQTDGNGPPASPSGERHLEPIRSEQARGSSLKRRGFVREGSTEQHQKKHQLDHVIIQPSGRPGSDSAYLGNSASKVVGVSADEEKLLAKRQRTDEHSSQAFRVAEHNTAADLPSFPSLPERRPPPSPSPTDQVENRRGESRIRDPKNVTSSASDLRVDDQQYPQSQKRRTLGGNVLSKTAARDSSGLHVQRSTGAHFSNSQVEDLVQIRNGENMSQTVNATPSRALEAKQETADYHVTRVDGGGGSLQPSRDFSNTNLVTTPDAAGVQVLSTAGMKMLPSASNSTHIVQSEVPDKLSLRDNYDPGDPGGYNPWRPSLQHFEAGGSHQLEHLGMQHTVVGGSGGFSLRSLREEEDSVDRDLEEAQAHRRDCEIRERELRRVYREAQIALGNANARCEALSQRRKYLSVQVQTAELQTLQQPPFSIHSNNNNSLVPFDPFNNITLPRITELPYPASTVVGTAKPSTEYELGLGLHRVSNEQEARIPSSSQVDELPLKVSSSSADTEILEENLYRTTHGHIPSTQEATFCGKSALSDKDEAPHYGFLTPGEVSISTNSESATSSQRLKIKKHTGTIASSSPAGTGELRLNNSSVDLQDSSHEDQDPLNRSMGTHDNDVSVPRSKDGGHTPSTPSIGQVAETEADLKVLDAREMLVNTTLETDRGLLEQEETRTAFGSDQCVQISLHTPGQGSFEDGGEVIRVVSSSTMLEPSTTDIADRELSNILKVPRQDFPTTEEAFANVAAEQDMDLVDLEGPKPLQADSRSDGIVNSELMTLKHSNQDESCREHRSDIPRLTISLKDKREISGLRALAEKNEPQQLDRGFEDTSDYNGQAIRPSLEEDLLAEGWATGGSNKRMKEQIAQEKDSEGTGDKGDCSSRTSVSSEGETRLLKGEDGREDSGGNGVDDTCLKLPASTNSAENRSPLADEGDLHVDIDLLHRNHDPSVGGLENTSTGLSIGFASLETGNVPALCLAYNQVVPTDKRFDEESTFRLASYESPLTMFRSYRMCSAFQTTWHNSVMSQTWSHRLDPYKPLCMFEHRGKCNDDTCPWQHMADYTLDDAHLLSQLNKYVVDPEQDVEAQKLSSLGEIINGASNNAGSLIISNKSLRPFTWSRGSPAPFYKIGPYAITQDEGLTTSRVRCCLSNQYKFNLFTSFTLSSAVRRPIHSDMPCLPSTVFFNIDSQTTSADSSGWRYTGERSLAAIEEHVLKEPGDIEAWLELALIRIDFDLNCPDNDAYNEALYVLSRALEANPTVATLWIVYIGLFYHGKGEIGDDDLFFHAIENSKCSYELLLLYINSRATLPERLKAYELALEALVNVEEPQSQDNQSACILDVVMQMVDCMCVAKETHLLHTWSEETLNKSSIYASILLPCLTPEDCCILMVGCAYAVAFGQLPQNYLLRLGCRQQLPWDLDWSRPSEEGSKDVVLKIMEAGMRFVMVVSHEVSEQVMAVNYLKCWALYNGSEYTLRMSRQILERHSTCVELVLFIVYLKREQGWAEVFQQALQKGATSQPRLWYQYAVHMLKAEGSVGAMNILRQCAFQGLTQWENIVGLDQVDGTREALQLNTRKFEKTADGNHMVGREAVFAWMNLALYEMLCGNETDAQLALEKSMKAAVVWEDVLLCWKEMASFIRISKTGQEQANAILDLLDRCSVATSMSCKLVPLACKLLSPISKRRVRVFLESLMGSPSIDHSLMNSVVEVIISKEPGVTKEVAMIVEALMETFPGNQELALRIYRIFLIGNLDSVADMAAAVWISSLLFGSLLQTSPVAPEQYWVEAGHLLQRLQDEVSVRNFYQFALVLHPFSARLKESAALFDDSNKPDIS